LQGYDFVIAKTRDIIGKINNFHSSVQEFELSIQSENREKT